MVLTAKKLRALGKEKLVEELSEIYLVEVEKAELAYREMLATFEKDKVKNINLIRATGKYHSVLAEWYHFLTD